MNVDRERIRKQSKEVAAYMMKPKKYHVEWDCPHCGNSHNWWWEDEFEAYDDKECDMVCDRCDTRVRCVGDGNGFYEPVRDEKRRLEELESLELDLHNYVRGLEDKVNTNNKLAFDAINTVTMRLIELENTVAEQDSQLDNLGRRTTETELAVWRLENGIKTPGEAKLGPQHVELAKEKEKSFLDLIHGEKPPFHERIREGCQLGDMDGITLASILRFIAVEVERMTERDMGGSFTISNVKAAAKLRELAEEAELADYADYDEDEDDDYRAPEKGDMWVSDDDPTVMKVFTGTEWLAVQQDSPSEGNTDAD